MERWIAAVNEGVRTGHWTAIEGLLRDDAQMEFVGIPVGPFIGRRAIVDAYRSQPPDDLFLTLGPVTRGRLARVHVRVEKPAAGAGRRGSPAGRRRRHRARADPVRALHGSPPALTSAVTPVCAPPGLNLAVKDPLVHLRAPD